MGIKSRFSILWLFKKIFKFYGYQKYMLLNCMGSSKITFKLYGKLEYNFQTLCAIQ